MAKSSTKASRLQSLRAAAPVAVALVFGALGGAGFAALNLPLPWMLGALAVDHRGQRRRPRAARARAVAAADDRRARGDARHHLHARAARGRAELAAQPGGAAALRHPRRRPDLSLSAALLRFRSDQRLLRRLARRAQRDDRAVRPARRRPAPRVAGARRAPPVHRVHDAVPRPGVRLPAAGPAARPGPGLRSAASGAARGARRGSATCSPAGCACRRRPSSGRCSAARRATRSAGSRSTRPIS